MLESIEQNIQALKTRYNCFSLYQDYHLFSLLCIRYFFFSEATTPFDPEIVATYLTDGSADGGIDAVFNDPNSEGNDVIIVQSKYYKTTPLNSDDVVAEVFKITQTLKDLKNCKISEYNEKLVTAFQDAMSNKEEAGEIKIFFFTSYLPKNKREQNKFEKRINGFIKEYDLEINFCPDIDAQIQICENGKLCVESDKLIIDAKDNFLKYEDSVIVNISAKSLQELQIRRRNGLLGMNLRYYVRQKNVDTGIEDTILKEPENFWYKNNGILIVCDEFKIDGKEIKLSNFSIVNGGQTTNRIGKINIENNFYLMCKIVKIKNPSTEQGDKFIHDIAEATNAQKPIKKADLKANAPEQLRLRERLSTKHVYYITKKGDKAPKQYSLPYEVATLEQIGKLGLAAILQMPGTARSNSQRMYTETHYYPIFGRDSKEGVLADLLKISYYYDIFLKTQIKDKGFDEKSVLPMLKNGKTYQLACISLLCKIELNVFNYEQIASLSINIDSLKNVLRNMGDIEKLIIGHCDDEESIFFDIFSIIGEEVLGYCFDNAQEIALENQKSLAPSDYLKSDINYYRDVIKRLWSRYNKMDDLHNNIKKICGKII